MKRSTTCPGSGRRVCLLAFIALAFAPLRCGRTGPEMVAVSGTVTYQGKPVPKGTISFVTSSPGQRNATGQLDQHGYYRLQTQDAGDGAELGDYNVTIHSHDERILDYKPKVPIKPIILAPTKYENPQTSGLKKTVKSGSNRFDFELTD